VRRDGGGEHHFADLRRRPARGQIEVRFLDLGDLRAGDAIKLTIDVANEINPNPFGYAFVTMQTTEGSAAGCN
jgi:hypothetical protein